VTVLEVDLDVLTPAERRDLANALLRAAWSATLAETRIRLLDLLLEVDGAIAWGAPGGSANYMCGVALHSSGAAHSQARQTPGERCLDHGSALVYGGAR
jgi:hypothetical protein